MAQVEQSAATQTSAASPEVRRLLRLRLPVIVKLAERKIRLSEVLAFTTGTIIEFDRPSEQPLDLMVNNVTVGQGDVVKIGENFGLRITRIGRPDQTIRALGGNGTSA